MSESLLEQVLWRALSSLSKKFWALGIGGVFSCSAFGANMKVTMRPTRINAPIGRNTPNKISESLLANTIMQTEAIIANENQQLTKNKNKRKIGQCPFFAF